MAVPVGLNVWSKLTEDTFPTSAGPSSASAPAGTRRKYRAYGRPFPPAKVRIAQLAEAIEIIRAMWTQAPARYAGEHYQISDAYCEPRPQPVPPVMVGGSGEKYLLHLAVRGRRVAVPRLTPFRPDGGVTAPGGIHG